jgi:molybdopterin-guanine dinucleotide biosynthesis protein A
VTEAADLFGLVLAGGKSRRMGSDKALLIRDGETQLARAVALLERHVGRVFVSMRQDQADEGERQKFARIVDRYDDMGPIAGVLSAMDQHPDKAWLVVACDLPNIDDRTIAGLIDRHDAQHPFTAYTSSYDGLPEPLCAVYGVGARSLVNAFIADGIKCPRKMLIRSDTQLLEQPNPQALDNVNTPEDLARNSIGFSG